METISVTEYVVHELSQHRHPDDVIKAVCEGTGMKWDEAKRLVHQIQVEHRSEIAKSNNTLIGLMSVGSLLVGLLLTIGIVVATIGGWIIFFLNFPIPYLGNLAFFGTGMGMILGGVMGLVNLKKPR